MEPNLEILKDSLAVKITAKDSGKVIGWAFLYVLKNDRHDEPFGFLENVYVEADFRGAGVGTKLVEAVIAQAKKYDCYKLIGTSRKSNTKAHAFYQRFGFHEQGIEFRLNLKESKPKQEEY